MEWFYKHFDELMGGIIVLYGIGLLALLIVIIYRWLVS